MKYLGGKSKSKKIIGDILNKIISDNKIELYWEPMCGGCWVTTEIICQRRIASDIHEELILMWRAFQDGSMDPFKDITEELYYKTKKGPSSAFRGFVGFCASFGGKNWAGLAREKSGKRNYAKEGYNSILKKIKRLKDVEFKYGSYNSFSYPMDCLIYCDPPYQGYTEYNGTPKFDHNKFWDWCRKISKTCKIIISEYNAPQDFKEIYSFHTKTDLSSKNNTKLHRLEKLFTC
jgi:DNA adenine methylase